MSKLDNDIEILNSTIMKLDTFQGAINSFEMNKLLIVLSSDLSYYHQVELEFQEVSFIMVKSDFRLNTELPFIFMLVDDELKKISLKFRIEAGNKIFKIIDEDGSIFYIAAIDLNVNYQTKKYFSSK